MQEYRVRTDLAVEEKERFAGTKTEVEGVVLEEERGQEDILLTTVKIVSEQGAEAMNKPQGNYITLERQELCEEEERIKSTVAEELGRQLSGLMPKKERIKVLIVGLGNRNITADALGPFTVDRVLMNRHDEKEGGIKKRFSVSGIIPGVMAQTGMESAEIIHALAKETEPDVVLVIDALAAGSSRRLNTTIQLTDTGIRPGSGVGNHRGSITEESIGVPVISIGVPTVIDGATIVHDTMDSLLEVFAETEELRGLVKPLENFTPAEKYSLIKELLQPYAGDMFVTPKDVDETVLILSEILAQGINWALAG